MPMSRLTSRRKSELTFLARDFAAYVVAFEPSLAATLNGLPAVTGRASWEAASSGYQHARMHPVTSESVGRVMWLNDVLQDAREAFYQDTPSGGICRALSRFARAPWVRWSFVGNGTEPLWKAALRIGCVVESDHGERKLLSPRVRGTSMRFVLGTLPAGMPTPHKRHGLQHAASPRHP